jgi:hypothetical protein
MRLRRLTLVCLLCLGVSLQGFAGPMIVEEPCPMAMEAMGAPSASSMHEEGATHECCTDAATFAKTGKLCKSGLECPSANQAPRIVLGIVTTGSLVERRAPFPDLLIDSLDPPFIWRPPALI